MIRRGLRMGAASTEIELHATGPIDSSGRDQRAAGAWRMGSRERFWWLKI